MCLTYHMTLFYSLSSQHSLLACYCLFLYVYFIHLWSLKFSLHKTCLSCLLAYINTKHCALHREGTTEKIITEWTEPYDSILCQKVEWHRIQPAFGRKKVCFTQWIKKERKLISLEFKIIQPFRLNWTSIRRRNREMFNILLHIFSK